jgi:hypothetical protein
MASGIMMDLRGMMQITMGSNGDVMVEGILFSSFFECLVGGGEGCWGNTLGNSMGAIKTTRDVRKTFFSLIH